MATKKKLLQAAAGTAAASGGAGGLNVEQLFSTYLYEGNGSSQVINNGINLGQSYGVEFDGVDDYMSVPASTDFEFGTGDFTVEAWVNTDYSDYFNIWQNSPVTSTAGSTFYFIGVRTNGSVEFSFHSGGGGFTTSAGAVSQDTWAHVAIVRNSGTTYIYVDGVQQTSSALLSGYDFNLSTVHTIGYRVTPNYASGYITDLRVVKGTAVYTSNFTAPTSPLTAITNTVLLTCQGDGPFLDNSSSSHTITVDGAKSSTFGPFGAAEAGEGGMVWIKDRVVGYGHELFDTERGVAKYLESSSSSAETTNSNSLTSFSSNGFTLGSQTGVNSAVDHVSWTFRKAPKFFDVQTWSGNSTARAISHNLGCEVGSIFIKRVNSANEWVVYHRSMANNEALTLNTSDAKLSPRTFFDNTTPTSTEFYLSGGDSAVNGSGFTYVAYLFAHNDGDGEFGPDGDADIIKCGSYTGNGSTDGPEIDLGFEPQFVILKTASIAQSWYLLDNMRGVATDGDDSWVTPDTSDSEGTSANIVDFNSRGFKIRNSFTANRSGENHIYIAIRRGPMAVPTDATDVFDVELGDNSGPPEFTSGFPVDFALNKNKGTSSNWNASARLTGATFLKTNATDAEASGSSFKFDYQDGYFDNTLGSDNASWMWRRAPNFFDVVAYTGTGTTTNFNHNLGAVPEMIWVKARDNASGYWPVYHKDAGSGIYPGFLNTSDAWSTFGSWWGTHTDSYFRITDSSGDINNASYNYIAYLFASVDGVSKVGSYTGNGGSQTIDCGFSSGARFVLIKRTDSTGYWNVVDSERGIVAGNDPILLLNETDPEVTGYDFVDPDSSGFIVNNAFDDNNASGGTYIFYAIA